MQKKIRPDIGRRLHLYSDKACVFGEIKLVDDDPLGVGVTVGDSALEIRLQESLFPASSA